MCCTVVLDYYNSLQSNTTTATQATTGCGVETPDVMIKLHTGSHYNVQGFLFLGSHAYYSELMWVFSGWDPEVF